MEANKPNEEKLIMDAKELVRLISSVCSPMSSSFSNSEDSIFDCAQMIYELSDPNSVNILIQCWDSNDLSWEDNQEVPTIVVAMMYKCLFFIYSTFSEHIAMTFLSKLSTIVSS